MLKPRIQSLDDAQKVYISTLKKKNSDLDFYKNKLQINYEMMSNLNQSLQYKDQEIRYLKKNISEIKETIRKLVLKIKIVENKMRKDLQNIPNDETIQIDSSENNHYTALTYIFSYLDPISLISASQACRLWRNCSMNSKLWQNVVISKNYVSNQLLEQISQFCSETNTIILKNLRPKSSKTKETLECNIESGLELILKSAARSLRTFAVIDCESLLTNRVAWLVSNHCRHVVNFIYISSKDCITSEMIWSLGAGCRKIKTLIIPPILPMSQSYQLTNRCLKCIGTVFSDLSVLCIGGHQIDKRGLIYIARHCVQLQTLELDHMGQIREKTAIEMCQSGLHQLNYLYITFTAITPKAILQFCRNCHKLNEMIVQLNFATYFKSSNHDNLEKYQETIKHINVLTKTPKLKRILYLKTDEG